MMKAQTVVIGPPPPKKKGCVLTHDLSMVASTYVYRIAFFNGHKSLHDIPRATDANTTPSAC